MERCATIPILSEIYQFSWGSLCDNYINLCCNNSNYHISYPVLTCPIGGWGCCDVMISYVFCMNIWLFRGLLKDHHIYHSPCIWGRGFGSHRGWAPFHIIKFDCFKSNSSAVKIWQCCPCMVGMSYVLPFIRYIIVGASIPTHELESITFP